jgi:hypothetical protein
MLRCAALIGADVSEERIASLILVILIMETMRSPQASILVKATRHNIPEDGIFLK